MRGSEIANRIADHLFGAQATRLVLARDRNTAAGGYDDLGGWCKQAIVDVIDDHLNQLHTPIEQISLNIARLTKNLDQGTNDINSK